MWREVSLDLQEHCNLIRQIKQIHKELLEIIKE